MENKAICFAIESKWLFDCVRSLLGLLLIFFGKRLLARMSAIFFFQALRNPLSMSLVRSPSTRRRGKSSPRRASLPPTTVDRKLIPRMKECLAEVGPSRWKLMSAEDIAAELQDRYVDYSRRKKKPFVQLVSEAHKWLCWKEGGAEERLQVLEQKHLEQRQGSQCGLQSGRGADSDSDSSSMLFDSDVDFDLTVEIPEQAKTKASNLMNNALHTVYQSRSTPPANAPTRSPSHTPAHCSSSPTSLCFNTRTDNIPTLRWTIDTQTSSRDERDGMENRTVPQQQSNPPVGQDSVGQLVTTDSADHTDYSVVQSKEVAKSGSIGVGVTEYSPLPLPSLPSSLPLPLLPESSNVISVGSKRASSSAAQQEGEMWKKGSSKKKRRLSNKDRTPRNGNEEDREEGQMVPVGDSDFVPIKSDVRFSDVGGNEETIQEVCKLLLHLRHPEVYSHLGVSPPCGFLLHGPPGCGKTLVAHAIAGEMDLPFFKLAATEVVTGISGESEEKIRKLFQKAKSVAPSLVFLDEIDAISPKRETTQREMERRIVAQLLSCMDDLHSSAEEARVVVIGATNRPDAIDPALRRAGRFDREISLGIPNQQARERILRVLCHGMKLSDDLNLSKLASLTPGFVGADLMSLTREAAMHAVSQVLYGLLDRPEGRGAVEADVGMEQCERKDLHLGQDEAGDGGNLHKGDLHSTTMLRLLHSTTTCTPEQLNSVSISYVDFEASLRLVQPSSKREGFVTVPDVTWDDIGALDDVREELTMAILAPVRYAKQFESLGLGSPPGVLLVGPPGCGKTLLAKAIANESGINFISVKGPELLNMYVGESERAVRQVFQRARNSMPCVIFFDELDSLCPRRSETADASASARVVNQLLTEMDGLESRKQVLVMGATNRPDIIDPAVLRPGRLDKVLYVGLPPCGGRATILRTVTKNGTRPLMSKEVSFDSIARDSRCDNFSGADLSALVREAAVVALKEHMQVSPVGQRQTGGERGRGKETAMQDSSLQTEDQLFEDCCVASRHFETAFSKVKASVSGRDAAFYKEMKIKYT